MDRGNEPRVAVGPGPARSPGSAEDLPDLEDALTRVLADEAAATAARLRLRHEPPPVLSPDERIAPLLEEGERVLALRRDAVADRREPAAGRWWSPGVIGDLYVTSRRLILVGRVTFAFNLQDIEDAMVSGERLLLVLAGGRGAMVEAACPRLLWVEIGAARAQASTGSVPSAPPAAPQPAVR